MSLNFLTAQMSRPSKHFVLYTMNNSAPRLISFLGDEYIRFDFNDSFLGLRKKKLWWGPLCVLTVFISKMCLHLIVIITDPVTIITDTNFL